MTKTQKINTICQLMDLPEEPLAQLAFADAISSSLFSLDENAPNFIGNFNYLNTIPEEETS